MKAVSQQARGQSPRPEARRPHDAGNDFPAEAFQNVVGSSAAIREAIMLGCRVATRRSTTVLIQGETGTGKELFARGIHASSAACRDPFVALNCAAIPEALMESELFGHERGAFSGAVSRRTGLINAAGQGTLFLDEIGELPLALQPKLLRVLEERVFRRVGGVIELPVACRIIAATNRPLNRLVADGGFRPDLFYRLSTFNVAIPPLTSRSEDIELLANYWLDRLCSEQDVAPKFLTPAALTKLKAHSWPGNVRELRNTMERALILADGAAVDARHILVDEPLAPSEGTTVRPGLELIEIPACGLSMREFHARVVEATLRLTGFNKSEAARVLGIDRATVQRILRSRPAADGPSGGRA